MKNPFTIQFRNILLFSLFIMLLSTAACEQTQPVHNTRFLAFGTLVYLSIVGTTKEQAEQAAQVIEQDFLRLHQEWHAWEEGTLVRVNRQLQSGETFDAPDVLLPMIALGRTLSIESNNLFNPAIGYLIDAWGFHSDNLVNNQPPSPETIEKLLASRPLMSDIKSQGSTLHCDNPAVKLDFGAIGKGYGINLAVARLKEMGIENAIVNTGGDLRAIGSRAGTPWRIAVRSPSGSGVLATLDVSGDESVFTSGDYERNYTYEGKLYHHIIDPRSGYPAEGTSSVTVLHTDAAIADAAATALFIAGPEHWFEIATQMNLRYVLLVDSEGTLHMNPAMQQRLNLLVESPTIRLSAPLFPHPA